MNVKNLLSFSEKVGEMANLYLRKNWPTIATYVGSGLVIAGTIEACKTTAHLDEIKEEALAPIYEIKTFPEEFPNERVYGEALTKAYIHGGWCFVKAYSMPVLMEMFGIGLIASSHHEMKTRLTAATTAFNSLQQSFNRYRQEVISDQGREADLKYRYGIKEKEVDLVTKNPETGELETRKDRGLTTDMNDPSTYSPFARFFDERSRNWERDAEYNLMFLKLCESRCTQLLHDRGYLFLNEVYDMLDIPPCSAARDVGWIYDPDDPNRSNYVDFGMCEVRRQAVRDFRNGYEKSILLDFNYDGNIIHDVVDVPMPRLWREPGTNIVHEV